MYEDEYLHCLAIIVDEIVCTNVSKTDMTGLETDKMFMTKKAYCIMFRNKHFKLQFHILASILKIQKHDIMEFQRLNKSNFTFRNSDVLNEYDDIIRQVESMTIDAEDSPFEHNLEGIKQRCFVSDNIINFLSDYQKLIPKKYIPSSTLNISIPYKLSHIKYEIPKSDICADIVWYGPFFLKKLKFDDFYYLLRAVLLEKSVVFISNNLNLLTAIINGFRVLLRPFKWCHLFISVLPKLLIDYMCAPNPMLVGIVDRDEFLEELDQDACDDKIWVELDIESGPIVHRTFPVPDFKLGGLKSRLKQIFKCFRQDSDEGMRFSTYNVPKEERNLSKNIGKHRSNPFIAEEIEKSLDLHVINWMRKYKRFQSEREIDPDFDDCKQMVHENTSSKDLEFIEQFMQSQMFAYYFDLMYA